MKYKPSIFTRCPPSTPNGLRSRSTLYGTGRWAGVDNAWEQEKPEANLLKVEDCPGKNACKPRTRSVPQIHCTICWPAFNPRQNLFGVNGYIAISTRLVGHLSCKTHCHTRPILLFDKFQKTLALSVGNEGLIIQDCVFLLQKFRWLFEELSRNLLRQVISKTPMPFQRICQKN